MSHDLEKQRAAEAAAEQVEPGMRLGLGSGTTVDHLVPVLARRGLSLRCVAASPRTARAASAAGLVVEPFDTLDQLDLVIDGADQIAPDGWLIKGGGGAHTREKVLIAAASRFIVIADSSKLVTKLHGPVPMELMAFGLAATLRRLAPTTLRDVGRSPDGGVIADYQGPFDDPAELARRLDATPGLVAHGLVAPAFVTELIIY